MFERIKNDLIKYKAMIIIILLYVGLGLLLPGGMCPFKRLTGLPCPGCGLTRSGLQVLKGDFMGALCIQPFIFAVIICGVIFFVFRYVAGGRNYRWFIIILMIVGIADIAYYAYQMLTVYPNQPPYTYYDKNVLRLLQNFFEKKT